MANTDNNTAAIIDQSNRRILAGYPFTIDCGVLGEDNVNTTGGEVIVTWYKDGTSLATGLSYTVTKPTEEDSGNYYFVATNNFGSTTSESVTIEIITPGEDQFKVNMVQNAYGENGIANWTPQIGSFRIKKFWATSGDKSWAGANSRFPNPALIDPKYALRDGLVFFTPNHIEYLVVTGTGENKIRTMVEANDGLGFTSTFQDIYITDPDTVDIIDRKVEGVFDVEAKCFGYLGQARAMEVYPKSSKYNSGFITKTGNGADDRPDYVETIRECRDEAKLRYEFYDANDEMMKEFEMDSFRPTAVKAAFAIGYRSISIPPGTRRVRIHMLFRRDDREHEWLSEKQTFAKSFYCGIHAVNFRIFINKDGLKFPSVKFNPDDIIDSNLDDLLEQQIMDAQVERAKCSNLIETLGNVELRNHITSDYKHPTQDGVLQGGIEQLTRWAMHEQIRYKLTNGHTTSPLPGKQGSLFPIYDINNIEAGPRRIEHGDRHFASRAWDVDKKTSGHYVPQAVTANLHISKRLSAISQGQARDSHLFLQKMNFIYNNEKLINLIIEAFTDSYTSLMGPDGLSWWEAFWAEYGVRGEFGYNATHKKNWIAAVVGGKPEDQDSGTVSDRIKIAYALAGNRKTNSYPYNLGALFFRPGKGFGGSDMMDDVLTNLYGGFESYYTVNLGFFWHSVTHHYWQSTTEVEFSKYYNKGSNYSILNTSTYNKERWLSDEYLDEFKERLNDVGEDRVYDDSIKMTVKEIYESIYDGDKSSAIFQDCVQAYVPPSSFSTNHWFKPNPDDPDTWYDLQENSDKKEVYIARLEDLSETKRGEFTYSPYDRGGYTIGYHYPCEIIDQNPVAYSTWDNNLILTESQPMIAKIIWPGMGSSLWFKYRDLMYNINEYTIMDYSLDDMVGKITESKWKMLENFFITTRSPIVFNEKISMKSAPYNGSPTGNFDFKDSDRNNTWHGYYSQHKYLDDNMIFDTPGKSYNGESFITKSTTLGTGNKDRWIDHKQLTVPEFYKKSVLSGDLNNMPQDAPFRYQGANPTKCLTNYSADDGVTSLVLNKGANLGPSSASRLARLDKMLRTYAMAFARRYYLSKRISFLNAELQEALDWVDTQGDEYGYDQTNTAVEDD